MFCNKCGEKMVCKGNSGNPHYPFSYFCKYGHERLSIELYEEKVGYKVIRTKTKDGFQTSHIPKEWEIPKDQDFHAVNLSVGFYSYGKT